MKANRHRLLAARRIVLGLLVAFLIWQLAAEIVEPYRLLYVGDWLDPKPPAYRK